MIKHIFHKLAALTLAVTLPASSWALPLTFEFSGTISDTVLISGFDQTLFTTHPEWNGLTVRGTLTMDFQDLPTSPHTGLGYTQHSQTEDYPHANWMSFLIESPDGSFLDVSDSEPVFPAPWLIGDDAYTELAHLSYLYSDSGFYAQRSYNNQLTYPRKHAALSLRSIGDSANLLTSSANYNDVVVRPEFADYENYGYVYHYTELGIGHEYSFKIDSLKRTLANVPEPSTWWLFISGFVFILLKRRQLQKI